MKRRGLVMGLAASAVAALAQKQEDKDIVVGTGTLAYSERYTVLSLNLDEMGPTINAKHKYAFSVQYKGEEILFTAEEMMDELRGGKKK